MALVLDLMGLIMRTLPAIFMDPTYIVIFTVVFLMIYNQYNKISKMEQRMFGLNRSTPLKETVVSMGYGLLGGILASFIFVFLGITLSSTGIVFLWLIAILLSFFHPRFLCFSYSAGVISVLSLVFGVPEIDIPSVMGLVAVLHLVEAVLIYFNGSRNASPIYIKHNNGNVVGGFSLHRFWPVPFATVIATVGFNTSLEGAVTMPEWWPLLAPNLVIPPEYALLFAVWPVIAGLGYSDLALTSSPVVKTGHTARNLALYSLALLGLAVLANHYSYLALLPALFAPLAHEWIIHKGLEREYKLEPLFTYPEGVMVLDVYPGSPAEEMGLQSGDVILKINGIDITSSRQLLVEMTPWLIDPILEVENKITNSKKRIVNYRGKLPPLGIIPVPHVNQGVYMAMKDGLFFNRLKKWWQKRRG